MLQNKNTKLLKLILSSAFLILFIGLLMAWNTPVYGYEVSIYSSTPIIFWIALIFGYIVGVFLIILKFYHNNIPKVIFFGGIILLSLCSISLACLGILRGNILIGITDDVGTHLGILTELLKTGYLSSIYPLIHIGPGIFSLFANQNVFAITTYYPILYLGIYILGLYVLVRELFSNKIIAYIVLLIALFLPFGSAPYLSPYSPLLFIGMQSTIRLMPLFIYIVIKTVNNRSKEMLILSLIMCISLTFYHPMASLLMGIFCLSIIFYHIITSIKTGIWTKKDIYIPLSLLSTITLLFILWSGDLFGNGIIKGLTSLFTISNTELQSRNIGEITSFTTNADSFGYSLNTIIQIGSINLIIYLSLFCGLGYFLWTYIHNTHNQKLGYVYSFSLFLIGTTGLFLIMDIGFKYSRFLDEIYLIGIISAGYIIYLLCKKMKFSFPKKKNSQILLPIFLCIVICLASIFLFYSSPLSMSYGDQTTKMEWIGAETLLPYIDYTYDRTGIFLLGIQRYISALYGSSEHSGSYQYGNYHIISTSLHETEYAEQVPYHFGYDKYFSINEIYNQTTYLFIIKKDRLYYHAYYPEIEDFRWTLPDFQHLENDLAVNHVYYNGDLNLYLIIE